jgi:hypothetical protein
MLNNNQPLIYVIVSQNKQNNFRVTPFALSFLIWRYVIYILSNLWKKKPTDK